MAHSASQVAPADPASTQLSLPASQPGLSFLPTRQHLSMIHFHYQPAGAIQYSQDRSTGELGRLSQQVIEDAGQIRHRDPTSLMGAHTPAAQPA